MLSNRSNATAPKLCLLGLSWDRSRLCHWQCRCRLVNRVESDTQGYKYCESINITLHELPPKLLINLVRCSSNEGTRKTTGEKIVNFLYALSTSPYKYPI